MRAARARRFGQLVASVLLVAGCNWLAGIDERETKQADGSGGERAAQGGDATPWNSAGDGGEGGAAGELGPAQGGTSASGGTSGAGDGGVGGAAGEIGTARGGSTASGGIKGSGGVGGGGAGGTAHGGTNASGGSKGSGGRGASGGTGAAGSTSTDPCSGDPRARVASGWEIYAGEANDGTIWPNGDHIQFPNGECVCFNGTVVKDMWSAQFYFQHADIEFTSLDLTLDVEPGSPLPTLYVHTTDGKAHCLVLSKADLIPGKPLRIQSEQFHAASQCVSADGDLAPGSTIDSISFEYDTYVVSDQLTFHICVLALAVN